MRSAVVSLALALLLAWMALYMVLILKNPLGIMVVPLSVVMGGVACTFAALSLDEAGGWWQRVARGLLVALGMGLFVATMWVAHQLIGPYTRDAEPGAAPDPALKAGPGR